VDQNEAVVSMARRRFPATRFDVADFDSLLASGQRFKAVTCINVIEHFEDGFRERFLREASRLLLPDGRLVIIYDNMYHPLQLLSGLLHPGMLLTDPTHIHCWTQGRFLRMLKGHFEVERAEGVNILSRGLPYTNRFSTAGLYVCAPKR
jgi:ubiquinone/menaquinone biosynthesis C-methylase UbiE